MANAAVMNGAPTRGGTNQSQSNKGKAPTKARPFLLASVEHRESTGYDVSTAMTTSVQTLPDITIPAYGYLRSILLVVTTSLGAGTGVTAQPDAPFNLLSNIVLQEPNGAQICNFPSGYDLFLANKFGGYWYQNDPRTSANFSVALGTAMNASFVLRVPVEVSCRDALGALPNQNSGALFRIKMNLNTVGSVFAGTLTTPPTVRIRAFTEAWDQPEDSTDGVPNQTVPPALNTTQYWTRQDFPVNAGSANVRLTRMGNYLRNLIFIYRDGSGVRSTQDANMPDPAVLYYDTRPLDNVARPVWLEQIMQRYGYGAVVGNTNSAAGTLLAVDSGLGRESSVWPYDFCHEFNGEVGRENRDLWLPTLSSTRFEIGGSWGATGTLSVLTNDVTITGNVWL
ncbi:MAG: hypothetical protein ACRDUW_03400 [Pseudonocardiaceae bacterium]